MNELICLLLRSIGNLYENRMNIVACTDCYISASKICAIFVSYGLYGTLFHPAVLPPTTPTGIRGDVLGAALGTSGPETSPLRPSESTVVSDAPESQEPASPYARAHWTEPLDYQVLHVVVRSCEGNLLLQVLACQSFAGQSESTSINSSLC